MKFLLSSAAVCVFALGVLQLAGCESCPACKFDKACASCEAKKDGCACKAACVCAHCGKAADQCECPKK